MSIEAMKQALEALSDFDYDKRMAAITALRQAIAEAERKSQEFPKHFDTHQSKREWVGLTDAEMVELFEKYGYKTSALLDAHESKLKKKNFT